MPAARALLVLAIVPALSFLHVPQTNAQWSDVTPGPS